MTPLLLQGLNNVTTADSYTAATTLENPGVISRENVTVTGAAVFYQQADAGQGQLARSVNYGPEQFLPPGRYNWTRRINGIKFRSAVAGTPAQITVEALA